MSESVRLVLTGEILPGHEWNGVRDQLAALLKVDAERSTRLLQSAPTVIKQQLPLTHIETYLALLAKAGAGARVEHQDGRPWQVPGEAAGFPTLLEHGATRPPPAPAPQPPAAVVAQKPASTELALVEDEPPETIHCPACGLEQKKRTLCTDCGADMPRMIAAQNQARLEAKQVQQSTGPRPVSSLRPAEVESMAFCETPKLFGFSLSGRLGRMRYLAYGMLLMLAIIPVTLLFSLALIFLKGFGVVFAMAWFWLFIRLMVFRLHDLGLSGWWATASIAVPVVAAIISPQLGAVISVLAMLASLALYCWPGAQGENRYGSPAEPPTLLINVVAVVGLVGSVLVLPAMMASTIPAYRDYVAAQKARAGQLPDANAPGSAEDGQDTDLADDATPSGVGSVSD